MTSSDDVVAPYVPADMQQAVKDIAASLLRNHSTSMCEKRITRAECEALYALGHGIYEQGRYAQALPIFAQLVVYDHQVSKYLAALAATAQMLGRYEEALRFHLAVLALKLTDPLSALRCVECLIELGRKVEAAQGLELAMSLCTHARHELIKARCDSLLLELKDKAA